MFKRILVQFLRVEERELADEVELSEELLREVKKVKVMDL